MSERQSFLQQRARLLQEQLKQRAHGNKAASAPASLPAPPATAVSVLSPASSTASQQPPQPSAPSAAVTARAAFATPVDDDVESVQSQISRHPKRAPPSLDHLDEPASAKKARLNSGDSGGAAVVDPLDAYMTSLAGGMSEGERTALTGQPAAPASTTSAPLAQRGATSASAADSSGLSLSTSSPSPPLARASVSGAERYYGDDEGAFDEDELDVMARDSLDEPKSKVKKKELHPVDHATYPYLPITKSFWIESREVAALSEEEVEERRRVLLEGVKIRGKKCPRPFFDWAQCGLSGKVAELVTASGYTKPFPIQAQAIPVIMSGRDCIACAKTGSGKAGTLTTIPQSFHCSLACPD